MSNSKVPYLHFYSQKSIEDQFIDDCLQFDMLSSKHDDLQTDLKVSTQKSISITQFASEKSLGRWTTEQSFIYLNTIKNYHQTKFIVKALVQKLPQRVESQIRAHHKKMIRKYGSIQQIVRCLDRPENEHLISVNDQLSKIEQKMTSLANSFNDFPN